MSNPFIEVVDKQRAFQHFHQCKNKLDDIGDELDFVYKEIERLKETLEFYALKRNYHNVTTDIVHKCGRVEWDMGKRARQALKEE